MAEQPPLQPQRISVVPGRFHELAERLRSARHLEPEAQQELANLMDELAKALNDAGLPSDETAHLAESTAHLVQVLHEQREAGLLAAAKERLEQAIIRAETDAPLATGIARQIVDTLANLGI